MLLADEDETVCNLFNVMKDKNMYGKKVRGIERSTFIIDTKKNIVKEWRKVNVDGHAEEVLNFIKSIVKLK
jgi:peroxiredoxin Q/BCP